MLEAFLEDPGKGWTRTQLAVASGQHAKARMDLHLSPLVAAGLVVRKGGIYRLAADHPVVPPLRNLFEELGSEPAC